MANPIFIDTSFVIALINKKDQHHEFAQANSYRFENSSLITTDAVLLEIGNALAKNFKSEAVKVIQVLRNGKNIVVLKIDSSLFEKGFEIYMTYKDKEWGLVDCISFAVMRDIGITEVLTFDHDFKQAGFSIAGDRFF